MQFGGCTYTKKIISFLNFRFTWCPLLPLAPRGSRSEGIQAREARSSQPGGCPAAPGSLTFLLPRRRCTHFTGLLSPDLAPVLLQPRPVPRKAGQRAEGRGRRWTPLVGFPQYLHPPCWGWRCLWWALDFYSHGPQLCPGRADSPSVKWAEIHRPAHSWVLHLLSPHLLCAWYAGLDTGT